MHPLRTVRCTEYLFTFDDDRSRPFGKPPPNNQRSIH